MELSLIRRGHLHIINKKHEIDDEFVTTSMDLPAIQCIAHLKCEQSVSGKHHESDDEEQ